MVRIRVLGRLELAADGRPVPMPASRRARALLGWLALHPGPHPRAGLAARFWPDVLDISARTSLRGALAELRRALGRAADEVLVAGRETVELVRGPGLWVDADAFGELVAAGRWADALELDRGRLLSDVDEEWVEAERDEHRRAVLHALERRAAAAEGEDALDDALGAVRRWVRLDPLSERAGRELVRLLVQAGDRSGALAAAQALMDRLHGELGLAPGPELRELVAGLRDSGAGASGAGASAGGRPDQARPHVPAPRPAPLEVPLPPAVALHHPLLLGRDAELEALEAVRELSRTEGAQVALVSGDAGIGKTSLAVTAARAAADDGALVLHGRCDEDGIVPFGPWVEALGHVMAHLDDDAVGRTVLDGGPELARLLPDLRRRRPDLASPVAVEPDTERWRLFEAVSTTIGLLAAKNPVLVVVDDVHWADRSTLLLLRHLVRSRRQDALTVIVTCRELEVPRDEPLHAVLADLHRDGVLTRLPLVGLAEAHVGELVTRRRGSGSDRSFVRALFEETEGNPFFVEEILRNLPRTTGAEPERLPEGFDVPQRVQDVVRRRLGRLPGTVRDTLVLASVVGREFDISVLERLTELSDGALLDALDEAVTASIVEETGVGRYSFAHALIRSALYDGLSRTRRARLHIRVAAALEALPGPAVRSRAGELAFHYLAAADPAYLDRAITCARQAYAESMEQVAYGEAAATARRAVTALEAADRGGQDLLGLLLDLGEALSRGGDIEAGREAFARAAEVARAIGDPAALAIAALGLAGPSWRTFGQVDEPAVDLLDEALARLGDDEPALRAAVQARLAIKLYFADQPERMGRLTQDALAGARALDDPEVLAAALEAQLWAAWTPDGVEERLRTAHELLALAESQRRPELAAVARRWRVVALMETCRVADADAEAELHARAARDLRLPYELMYVAVFATAKAILQGRFDDARRESAAVADYGDLRGGADALQFAGVHAVSLAREDGRMNEVVEPIREFAARYPSLKAWQSALALALAESDRGDEARVELDRVWPPDEQVPFDAVWMPAVVLQALTVLRLGLPERCAYLYRLLRPYAGRAVVMGAGGAIWGTVNLHLGGLAAGSGQFEPALGHLGNAVEELRAMGADRLTALAEQARDGLLASLSAASDRG